MHTTSLSIQDITLVDIFKDLSKNLSDDFLTVDGSLFKQVFDTGENDASPLITQWLEDHFITPTKNKLSKHNIVFSQLELYGEYTDDKNDTYLFDDDNELIAYVEWFIKSPLCNYGKGNCDKLKISKFVIGITVLIDKLQYVHVLEFKFTNKETGLFTNPNYLNVANDLFIIHPVDKENN